MTKFSKNVFPDPAGASKKYNLGMCSCKLFVIVSKFCFA